MNKWGLSPFALLRRLAAFTCMLGVEPFLFCELFEVVHVLLQHIHVELLQLCLKLSLALYFFDERIICVNFFLGLE